MTEYEAQAQFVRWLDSRVLKSGRGDGLPTMENEPRNKLWLGRLTSEASVMTSPLGNRGERLEPCATGLRVLPAATALRFTVTVRCCAWLRQPDKTWRKTPHVSGGRRCQRRRAGNCELRAGAAVICVDRGGRSRGGLTCEVRTELERSLEGHLELTILVVNTSPEKHDHIADTTLYEVSASVTGLATTPYLLEGLPDSFRYDRRVTAYGINGGYEQIGRYPVDHGHDRRRARSTPVLERDLARARSPFRDASSDTVTTSRRVDRRARDVGRGRVERCRSPETCRARVLGMPRC